MLLLKQIARWVAVIGIVVLSAQAAHAKEAAEPFGRLSVDEVAKLLQTNSAFIFDNNNRERYEQGHVPGAIWVSIADFDAKVLPKDKAQKLVFYCANEKCMACHAGAKKAIALGYKNVFIMPAGIFGWEKAGKPVEKKS